MKMSKPVGRILVTNDDGINAPGLKSAIRIARQLSDDVWVFAPREEKSGASHSLSLAHPMQVEKKASKKYAISGTPTDCVMIAIHSVLRDAPPDMVLSGVNFGQNIAEDISYSGTVAGAKEGTLFGIPSVALSQAVMFDQLSGARHARFEIAEKYAASIIDKLLKLDWHADTLMNINFPDIEVAQKCKIRVTRQGKRDQRILCIEERVDPRNNPYYWYDFNRIIPKPGRGTDIEAIMQGDISITPLQMDHTDQTMKKKLDTLFG